VQFLATACQKQINKLPRFSMRKRSGPALFGCFLSLDLTVVAPFSSRYCSAFRPLPWSATSRRENLPPDSGEPSARLAMLVSPLLKTRHRLPDSHRQQLSSRRMEGVGRGHTFSRCRRLCMFL